jgi:penicillin-binding protein 1A
MPSTSDRITPRTPRRRAPRRQPRRWLRWVGGLVAVGAVLAIAGVVVLASLVWSTAQTLPSFRDLVTLPRGQSVTVRAYDGTVLAHIGPNYGQWLPYNEIPTVMREAMVAVEDRRFYHHPGIDPIGIARAMRVNLSAGRWVQGGSTITQQVAKNLFLTSARTFDRKSREMILALALEWSFTKEEILELYLNRVYFGGGAYGIDAASRRFYGHSARSLTTAEAALIAGLVRAPSRYAPSADPRRSLDRAAVVLTTMVDSGRLTPAQAADVRFTEVAFAPQPRENDVRYFTDWVLTQVEALTDEAVQPIDVMTTLDPRLQRAAEATLRRNAPEGVQGAVVALAYDGGIRALVGGVDYVESPFNRAIQARRQPGSAFKLFVYLAALEAGRLPDDVEFDEPITLGNWSPVNSSRTFQGEVTLTQAFAQSINTVAVKLADEIGTGSVAQIARRLGISTPISRNPSMALGASEVTLLDLTGAYAAVARGGTSARPYAIRQIVRADGEVLYSYAPGLPEQVLSADTAAAMTRMMQAVVDSGTGRAAQIGRPVAGKTGTSSDNKDGWFIGFTGDMTTGVWLGRDDARPVPGLAGGRLPTILWADFMKVATEGLPAVPLFGWVDPAATIEPDQEVFGLTPPPEEGSETEPGVFAEPAEAPPPSQPEPEQSATRPRLSQEWLDRALAAPPPGAPAASSPNPVQQRPVAAQPPPG